MNLPFHVNSPIRRKKETCFVKTENNSPYFQRKKIFSQISFYFILIVGSRVYSTDENKLIRKIILTNALINKKWIKIISNTKIVIFFLKKEANVFLHSFRHSRTKIKVSSFSGNFFRKDGPGKSSSNIFFDGSITIKYKQN